MKTIQAFYVGQMAELMTVFTEEKVVQFADISNDHNPIHLDREYASKSRFGKRIVHGFLVGSLISAVIANVMPGEGSIYVNQNLNFKRPVFWNDEIRAKVVITNIDVEKSLIELSTVCINQCGKNVIEGTAVIYYPY